MSFKYTNVFILFIILTFIIQPAYSQPQTEKKLETTYVNEQNENKEKAKKIEKEEESSKKENDIELRPIVVKGSRLGKRKKKNIQKLSRHTMAAEELKHVPASFGDALTALTALPGIMQQEGFIFGALVIRGADVTTNNYYLDDMPIYNPMHFGDMHSVIATNFIDEIYIYASSFSANFGFATSGIINISSVDEVKEFGGYSDFGLISVSSIIKMPILKDKNGDFIYDTISIPGENTENENAGYFIASGRYAFFKLAIELGEFIMRVDDDTRTFDFKYWDYQAKSKYYLNNAHSVTMLFIGHKDYFTSEENGSDFEDDKDDETNDPIFQNLILTEQCHVPQSGFLL